MSVKLTALPVILIAVCLSFVSSRASVAAASGRSDMQVLARASVQLGHSFPASVVRWLRSQRAVSSAAVGQDHQTVSIRFHDGLQAAILGRSQQYVAAPLLRPLLR